MTLCRMWCGLAGKWLPTFVLATFAILGLSRTALAKDDEQKSKKSEAVDANGKKITVVNFEEASIEGNVRRPDGMLLESRSKDRLKGIIDLRKDFRLQMKANGMSRK